MEVNQVFVNRVRDLRAKRGVSAKTASELCGLGPNYFHRIESGLVAAPTCESLSSIADYFGVTMEFLWGKTDTMRA